jgi:hypothetical protein
MVSAAAARTLRVERRASTVQRCMSADAKKPRSTWLRSSRDRDLGVFSAGDPTMASDRGEIAHDYILTACSRWLSSWAADS